MSSFDASVDLPPTADAPAAARHIVGELLRLWRAPQSVLDVQLLVTELVTNAVEHVAGEASLAFQVSLSDGWLRVALADGSSVRPVVRELTGLEPKGRGVQLIDAVASRWGAEDHHGGKRVWFELAPADHDRA